MQMSRGMRIGECAQSSEKFADYTNELSLERERFEESDGKMPRHIQDALDRAWLRKAGDVPVGSFRVPDRDQSARPNTPRGSETTSIQYRAKVTQVDELKDALALSTNRQVGEASFERLYEEEIG